MYKGFAKRYQKVSYYHLDIDLPADIIVTFNRFSGRNIICVLNGTQLYILREGFLYGIDDSRECAKEISDRAKT
jgi:hypothetical protein